MRSHFIKPYAWAGLALGLGGCVEPYVPAVVDAPTSALVVDGFINGNGRTRIKLSRTTSLATSASPPVEKGAKLFIVDDTGQRYALVERASGSYQSDSLVLTPARQYQLRITTAANATYESDRVPLKVTPPIDKLNWQLAGNYIQILLSTRDPRAQARYYRWKMVETWEFTSAFKSTLEYDAKQMAIVGRTTPIYTCWRTENPSTIKQSTTAQLSQDALTDVGMFTIPIRAERLKIRYSMLVSQYAETAEEFAYNELLRKNTEAVGTVNDPLPVQLSGNVHRLANTAESVLGFVGAGTVQTKRLFIDRQELPFPKSWVFDTPYNSCQFADDLPKELFNNPGNVPISYYMGSAFTGATRECVDCRLRGSNMKPSFW
jgi:hypothetical protein